MLAGDRVRDLRKKLGFTAKDVEEITLNVSQKLGNPKYWVPQSRLSQIENRGIVPSIYRLHALAIAYRRPLAELLDWYGVSVSVPESVCGPPRTHLATQPISAEVEIPTRLDPLFDPRKTSYIRRMIQEWGVRPLAALESLQRGEYTYGYLGTDDYSMYPMLLPGSFVQIDPRLTEIETGPWASELERPIYFLETHDGYLCSWCAVLSSREIQVQPHTLSGLAARTYRLPDEIEVVGQVVGIATRLRKVSQSVEREPAMLRTHS